MSLRINLNTAAMNAHRNLASADAAMGSSIEKLSSGYRINRGADDPAGLVVSENMRAQVSGLGQAIANSNDAVNMVKTAEGAMTETNSLLRSMRDLAVHASNVGANDPKALAADQAQIQSAITALNRISDTTQFGTKKLLDGSAGISISAPTNTSVVSTGSSATAANYSLTATAATKASITGTKDLSAGGAAVGSAGTLFLGDGKNSVSIAFAAADRITDVVAKINAYSTTTGVVAGGTTDLTLTQKNFGSAPTISTAGTSNADLTALGLNGVAVVAGTDVSAAATNTATGAVITMTGSGQYASGPAGSALDGVKLNITASQAATTLTVTSNALKFQIGANAAQTTSVAVGDMDAAHLGNTVDRSTLTNSTWNVGNIDVTSFNGAQDAIKILDAAISEVSDTRASLGAFQKNQLESNINSIGVAKENLSASESSIRDTDMAAEMSTFTRNQIMMQAGTSMLTQANQAPQSILSLLK